MQDFDGLAGMRRLKDKPKQAGIGPASRTICSMLPAPSQRYTCLYVATYYTKNGSSGNRSALRCACATPHYRSQSHTCILVRLHAEVQVSRTHTACISCKLLHCCPLLRLCLTPQR